MKIEFIVNHKINNIDYSIGDSINVSASIFEKLTTGENPIAKKFEEKKAVAKKSKSKTK